MLVFLDLVQGTALLLNVHLSTMKLIRLTRKLGTQNVPTNVNGPKFTTFCHFLTFFDFAATFRKLINGLIMVLSNVYLALNTFNSHSLLGELSVLFLGSRLCQ